VHAIGNRKLFMSGNVPNKILQYGILALSVSSVGQWLSLPIGPTILWWAFYALMIWTMIRSWDKSYIPFWLIAWMLFILISSVVGTQFCRDYWDWKMLVGHGFGYAICLTTLAAYDPERLQQILGFLYEHFWKIFILLALFLSSDGISKFMLPISFLAIFYPILNKKYRRYVLAGLLITLIFGYDGRADIIKSLFCVGVGLFSLRYDTAKYARRYYWVLYILPFLLFILAANGTFNIFTIGESMSVNGGETGRITMADSRTALYEDVIETNVQRGTILFGGTPARGYFSRWMVEVGDNSDILGDIHYGERGGTESSVLNVFLHFGIVGLLIYMMVFWRASYMAIFMSNNVYIPIVGLCVAFRFLIGWIEDFDRFDLNMFMLWMMIGMCYSPYFREMSDDDFCEWFDNVMV